MIATPVSVTFRLRSRPAFTLVELMVAMAIVSIIMVAIGSTVLIAASAVPNGDSSAEETIEISRVVNGIVDELRAAIHITERSKTAVTFTIADRTGDSIPEVIRYAWSGTVGDPLTRQFNVGAVVTVLDDVQKFDLAYNLKSVTEQYPGQPVESAETELISYDSGADLDEAHVHGTDHPISYWGQYFKPTLPADTVSWTITRVTFNAKEDNEQVPTTIDLRLPAADQTPSDTIVDTVTLDSSSFPGSYQWIETSFSNASGLSPSAGLCLTFTTPLDRSARLRYSDANVVLPNVGLVEGTPAWGTLQTDESLLFYVYGTTTALAPNQTITRDHIGDVRVTLLAGDSSSLLETSVQTLNTPEALTAVWEADFSADPTLIDLNGDGVGDWSANNGAPFDVSQLDNGIYWADGVLLTAPENDFTQPTTVELRFRDFVDDGKDGGLRMRVDWTGDAHAYIKAMVELSGGQQNLSVSYMHPTDGDVVLVSETAAPGEFFDLRLLVDPAQDTVNININDTDRGTFLYIRKTVSKTHAITLLENGDPSGVQFDWVRVRVGGTGS